MPYLTEEICFSLPLVLDSSNATIIPPKVVSAKEGSSAKCPCNASGIPSPNVIWTRQNGKSVADSVKYQVTTTSGSSLLTIRNVSVEDQGYYLCNASNFDFDVDRAFLGVTCKFLLLIQEIIIDVHVCICDMNLLRLGKEEYQNLESHEQFLYTCSSINVQVKVQSKYSSKIKIKR